MSVVRVHPPLPLQPGPPRWAAASSPSGPEQTSGDLPEGERSSSSTPPARPLAGRGAPPPGRRRGGRGAPGLELDPARRVGARREARREGAFLLGLVRLDGQLVGI